VFINILLHVCANQFQDFVARNGLTMEQRRRVIAAMFVNMERVESDTEPSESPIAFVIRIEGKMGDHIDDLLCDDDMMSMLNVEKELSFCDRNRLPPTKDQRRSLMDEILLNSRVFNKEYASWNRSDLRG
jgi:hypothetical protein